MTVQPLKIGPDQSYLWVDNGMRHRSEFAVFLDGEERTHVVEADEEQRFIVRLCTDERGELVVVQEPDGGQHWKKETLRGDVSIRRRP